MAMTQTGKTVTQFVTQIGTEKAPNRQRFDENRLKMMEVVGSPRLHQASFAARTKPVPA